MKRKKSPMRGSSPLLFDELRIRGKLHYSMPYVKGVRYLNHGVPGEPLCDLPLSDYEYVITYNNAASDLGVDLMTVNRFDGYPVALCLNF